LLLQQVEFSQYLFHVSSVLTGSSDCLPVMGLLQTRLMKYLSMHPKNPCSQAHRRI
jgi:hypothetical protein